MTKRQQQTLAKHVRAVRMHITALAEFGEELADGPDADATDNVTDLAVGLDSIIDEIEVTYPFTIA